MYLTTRVSRLEARVGDEPPPMSPEARRARLRVLIGKLGVVDTTAALADLLEMPASDRQRWIRQFQGGE